MKVLQSLGDMITPLTAYMYSMRSKEACILRGRPKRGAAVLVLIHYSINRSAYFCYDQELERSLTSGYETQLSLPLGIISFPFIPIHCERDMHVRGLGVPPPKLYLRDISFITHLLADLVSREQRQAHPPLYLPVGHQFRSTSLIHVHSILRQIGVQRPAPSHQKKRIFADPNYETVTAPAAARKCAA